MINNYEIRLFKNSDYSQLLKLLLELQSTFFLQTVSKEIKELQNEKDYKKSYKNYLDLITNDKEEVWKVLLAKDKSDNVVGFIIGSITLDEDIELGKIGKIEDWFVETSLRRQGIGIKLYQELEKWFKEKGCQQVQSDTWIDYKVSIKAHQQAGFFISGMNFRKKI